jgi:C-terminal processing protease CtpA/Prc
MDRHYSFFNHKAVDWDAVYATYQPQVAEAASETEYFQVIDQMLNELPDGHTGLLAPDVTFEGLRLFGYAGEYEGQAVIIAVGPEAERAGIEKGALLLAVDGAPIEDAVQTWSERVPPSSTPWHHRKRVYLHLLATFEETLEVTFENPGGTQQTATLTWDPSLHENGGGERPPVVTHERLDSGVGVIRIRNFNAGHGLGLVRDFDAALDALFDAPGIIIDVRNNGGGFSVLADQVAGRFFSEPFTYGREHYRTRLPQHVWRTSMAYRVRPRGETYTGPVAVLTNPFTFSSADTFVVAMAHGDRAQIVGRPTSGASGNPIKVRLPGGGLARFSTGDFVTEDGVSLEGVGTQPDLPVAWTIEDVRQENDPDVEVAEDYLLSAASGP